MLCCVMLCYIVLYCTVLCCVVLCYILSCCTVLHFLMLFLTFFHIVLFFLVVYCIVLYCMNNKKLTKSHIILYYSRKQEEKQPMIESSVIQHHTK